jgi:hypothetical protein
MITELALYQENPGCLSTELNPSPSEFRREIVLSDGSLATLRPICSADKQALVAFHSRLSAESLFLRYHYSKGQLTEKDLQDLCDIDYSTTMALVAEVERNGHREIIGVGRYIRLPFDHTAEVAFIVQDSEQNKGIGTQLLQNLAILAWQKEIYFFFGEVLRQNGKMLTIFRKSDPGMKQEADSACTCTVTLSTAEVLRRAA